MPLDEIIFFGIIGAVIVVVVVWILVRLPGSRVAEIAVEPGKPFELHCAPADRREYRVCLDYALVVPGRSANMYGIACAVTGEINGKRVLDEVIGVGYRARAAGSITMEAKTLFKGSTTRYGDGHKVSGVAVLAGLGPRSLSSEIVVRGSISTPDDIAVESMSVAVTR